MTEKSMVKDQIYINGKVYTMDSDNPLAEAFAVRDGRFLSVGDEISVRSAASSDVEVVDLEGRMVMPGMIDVHNHFLFAGRGELYETLFSPILSLDQILEQVRRAVAQKPASGWVVGGMVGSRLLATLTSESLDALDSVSEGYPVLLRDDSFHNRWVNTAALQLAGIDASTPNPPGGAIGRDHDTGKLTGLLTEAAVAMVESVVSKALASNPRLDIDAASHAVRRLNSLGVTAFQDAVTLRSVMAATKAMDEAGILTCWVVGSLPVVESSLSPGEFGEPMYALRDQYRSRHFRPDAGKIFMDGVPTTRTASMLEPYMPDGQHPCCFCGTSFLTVPQLARAIADAEREGLSVKIHCTGDGSVRDALDAIEVCRVFRGPGCKHHIAHASFIDPADIPRFAGLNVVADLSPMIWVPSVISEAIQSVLSLERGQHIFPNRDLHEAGALLAMGSDWPIVPDPNPLLGIQGMVTRCDPSGQFEGALWPEQALELATALQASTINPAIAMGIDDETGSITTGKSAEFIVLDRNLFDIAPQEIASTRVLATYFEGRKVYEGNA
jgi:predicted amidohydrolase YtcJ